MKEMSKIAVGPIPTSIEEFVKYYPNVAKTLADTKTVSEWNDAREVLKNMVHHTIINYIDTSGIIKNKKIVKFYLSNIV